MSDNENSVLDNPMSASVKTVTPPQGLISPPSLTEKEIQVSKLGQIKTLLGESEIIITLIIITPDAPWTHSLQSMLQLRAK